MNIVPKAMPIFQLPGGTKLMIIEVHPFRCDISEVIGEQRDHEIIPVITMIIIITTVISDFNS